MQQRLTAASTTPYWPVSGGSAATRYNQGLVHHGLVVRHRSSCCRLYALPRLHNFSGQAMSSTQQQWRLALAVTMGCVFAPAHSQETSRTPVQVPEPTPLTTTKVSLAELNARLRGANPDIAIALAASRGGDALVRSADTSLNPTLSFGAASISNSQGIGAGSINLSASTRRSSVVASALCARTPRRKARARRSLI
jgi:hypothetical protein